MFCKAFSKSLVIEPGGTIAVCCSDGSRMLNTSIKDVTSLKDFFYKSKQYNDIRDCVKKTDLKNFGPCSSCHRSLDGMAAEIRQFNEFRFPEKRGYDDTIDLKFLEVTTSNTCLQSCIMCGDKYSSTHAKLSGHSKIHNFGMTDGEMEMIYDILPGLEYICLKGGEPFADRNNLKILQRLYECNPSIKNITIVSNGQNIPQAFKDILIKYDKDQLNFAFSLDGYDEVYKWQRGSDYSKTVKTLNQFYDDTNFRYVVMSTITAYTLPSLVQTFERHMTDLKGVRHYVSTNVVWNPPYTATMQYTQDQIDKMIGPVIEYETDGDVSWNRAGLESIKSFGHNNNLEMFKQHTEKWNNIRKLNIYDYVPELSLIS